MSKISAGDLDVTVKNGENHEEQGTENFLLKIWKAMIALSTFLSLSTSSYLACFDSSNRTIIAILYSCDCLYLIDMILRLRICIRDAQKQNSSHSHSAQFKLRLILVIDVISLIPFEILAIGGKSQHSWMHETRLYRLSRIPRFYNLFSFFAKLEGKLGSRIQIIRAFRYGFTSFALVHLMACGWFSLSCANKGISNAVCYPDSWATGEPKHPEKIPLEQPVDVSPPFDVYWTSLYWAANTATSTGYGDIHGVSHIEKWYSILCMMIGVVFFFVSILGDMGSSMNNSDVKRATYKHKLNAVIDHLHHKDICKETKDVVHGYYEHMWNSERTVGGEDILHELPTTFQAEILLNVNRHVLEKVPLFKDTSNSFKRMLSPYIKSTIHYPGQILFKENDIGHTLYYIRRGEVQIVQGDDRRVINTFKKGSYFGEISVVLNVPRTATARVTDYCDILSLEKVDLSAVLRNFPNESAILNDVIEARYKQAELNRSNHLDVDGVETYKEIREKRKRFPRVDIRKAMDTILTQLSSSLYAKWRFLIFMFTLVFVLGHTYVASFEVTFGRHGYGESFLSRCLYGFWYLYDVMLVLDILLDLRTPFEHPQKGLFQDPKLIRQFRFKTFIFWLNVLSVLPIELFALCFTSPLARWYAATFLKSNRLIRSYHIPKFFKSLENNINSNISRIRAMKLSLYLFLATHVVSCVWFLQACFGTKCAANTWAQEAKITEKSSHFSQYLISVYWACATMTSTGYGDITAVSQGGEIVVIFVLLLGLLLYGYCLSCIAATLNNLIKPESTFAQHVSSVMKFMKDLKLSDEMISDVSKYYKIVWQIHKGQSFPGSGTLMNDMPLALREDVSYEEMGEILQDVPIFKDTDERFQKMVSVCAKSYLFTPGDTIVSIGDMCRDIYIVRRGQAEILSADKSCVVATFGPGGYFGEVGFLYGESRPSDVRAKTYCEIVMVSKQDLDRILPTFPVIAKQLQHLIDNIDILKKIQVTAHDEAKRSVIKNSTENKDKSSKGSEGKTQSDHSQWKPMHVNPLHKVAARKISLPTRVEGVINEKMMTPEFRRERISILHKQELQEFFAGLNPFIKLLSKLLFKNSISPQNSLFRLWTLITAIIAYIYLILIGFQVSFTPDSHGIIAVCYIFDGIFFIDMYLKMHVSYHTKNGIPVTCTVKTAAKYLNTNFLLDFLALIPFELFIPEHHGTENFAKLNRLLHFVKIILFFSFFDDSIRPRSVFIKHFGLGSYLVLITHYFACAWFFIACPEIREHHHAFSPKENASLVSTGISGTPLDFHHMHFKCGEKSWAGRMDKIEIIHEKLEYQYIASLYWAISTLCSVGYGDIHAYISAEMVLSCVCMVFGVVYFGYIFASILVWVTNDDDIRATYKGELDSIKLFLKAEEVEPSLARRVLSHFEYVWKRTNGMDLENAFKALPASMQGDICLSLHQSFLLSVPVFEEVELGFIKLLSRFIKPSYILKGEYILKKGDLCQQIVFIHHGTAEVVSDDEEPIVLRKIGPGHFFGDVGVVCNSSGYSSIRAHTHMDLFVLTKKDLESNLNSFPQIKSKILRNAHDCKSILDEQDRNNVIGCEIHRVVSQQDESNISLTDEAPDFRIEDAADIVLSKRETTGCFKAFLLRLQKWNRFVITVDSPIKYIEKVNLVGIFVTYLFITYMAAFGGYTTFMLVICYLWEASFLLEMYLNFHMAYELDNGEVVDDFDQIWKHYVKGKFKLDLVAILPLDLLAFAFSEHDRLMALSYLRLIHVLRTIRIFQFYHKSAKQLNVNILVLKSSKNFVEVILALHTFACGWYMMACLGEHCSHSNWLETDHEEEAHGGHFERYNDCIYWAVATVTSTGYGDIHATNAGEMVYASLIMLSGKVITGFVLGELTSALATTEIHRVGYEEKLQSIQSHMRGQNISLTLQKRVLDFFLYSWKKTRGLDVTSVLHRTPYCLRAELYASLIGDTLLKVPMFKNCSQEFLRFLCSKAQYCHFSTNEFVTRMGDMDQSLYIIRKGQVEGFVSGNAEGTTERTVYGKGSFFGELNVMSRKPCVMTIKTITDVELFVFKSSAIDTVLQSFEKESQYFDYYTNRLRRLSVIEEEEHDS